MAKYKLLPGFDSNHTGEIFDTEKPVPKYDGWSRKWDWNYILTNYSHRFELVPEENLPENWVIKITSENKPILREHALLGYWYGYDYSLGAYYGNSCRGDWGIPTGAKEISWDQFKRLVLKEESVKEKEIIGYKAPFDFTGTTDFVHKGDVFTREGTEFFYTNNGLVKKKNKLPAQIVEQWEPVYKESHPDMSINGYKGEFFEGYVKFGCAKISKQMFVDLHSKCLVGFDSGKYVDGNKEIESVTIGKGTFTKHQIKEIAEYYLNKK